MSDEHEDKPWWHTFLIGVGFLAGSVFFYWYFTDFENSDETSRRMNSILALLYNIGGKWLVCGLAAAIGAIACFLGIREYLEERA